MAEFTMPSLGADMDEGLLLEWLVGPGDRVNKGDVVAVVETDKAAIEIECFESGTMGQLLVEPGTRVPVGTPLAVIEGAKTAAVRETAPAAAVGEAALARGVPEAAPTEAMREGAPVEAAAEPVARLAAPPRPEPAPAAARGRKLVREPALTATAPVTPSAPRRPVGEQTAVEAGPLVRHLAAERGVDLTSVHGTGHGGRITRADVEHAVPAPAPRVRATPYARRRARELDVDLAALHGTGDGGAVRAADVHAAVRARGGPELHEPQRTGGRRRREEPVPEHPVSVSREDQRAATMRRAIGELMSRSKKEIPHYYLSTTIDLAAAADWLRRRNRGFPPSERLVPAALLLRAAAVAAREAPQLNGFWQDGGFTPGTGVHLGVAVSLRDGGLLTPVIHAADTLRPEQLMAALKDLVQRARRGRLRGSDLSGATLTVTNLGDQGVETVYGVIYPPQVALVGFGAVVERPWATGGLLGVRPVVTATLSADHRASDGAIGARYLTAIDRLLQRPEEL
ncbi:dihydrolipoamide acetyltransferase family protein [Streptomyces sp. S.PB5]|uniref:dihydrolipoamide acetyltransferase family protein n=1 Tax=Streptomyces sp. S.PB5 TaxID=3020844 RepID=UPI0025AF2714|nr:dihydrolipoamide acetyltransferase family protein [Streptomyces sp. S.PB5]MDN3028441.1 dihydrolipoamide acetyltransferase family protein [Streptomyces sp. S.PB5]